MNDRQISLFDSTLIQHPDAERETELWVVRSHAHAKEITEHLAKIPAELRAQRRVIWTLRDLYERISWLGLCESPLSIDDDAHTMAAADVVAAASPFAIRGAIDVRNLHRQLAHTEVRAHEIATKVEQDSARGAELAERFLWVNEIERRLKKARSISRGHSLYLGVVALEAGAMLPQLRPFARVHIMHPVDPSALEVRAICALAESGVSLRVTLPVDDRGRGLAEATDWIAKRFEAIEAPDFDLIFENLGGQGSMRAFCDTLFAPALLPEVQAPVRIFIARDRTEEAREIARQVAGWRKPTDDDGVIPKIAVAFRTLDRHAQRVADALERFGVPVSLGGGRPLSEAPPAQLLLDFLSARREGVPRERLLNILSSVAYKNALPPGDVGDIARRLRRAVARSDVEDVTRPSGGYRHRLERLASGAGSDEEREEITQTLNVIEEVLEVASVLKTRATLSDFLEASQVLLRSVSEGKEAGVVLDQLSEWSRALQKVGEGSQSLIELSAFVRWLERALREVRVLQAPAQKARAVELCALPDLFGRVFDYVVIADCVHGRMPLAINQDDVLSDGDRKLVNRAMQKVVLRVFETDSLEPSPVSPRQALEPLWFMGAVSAAHRGLFLSAASSDERGRDVAPSAFLEEALIACGAAPDAHAAGRSVKPAPDPRTQRVSIAKARMGGEDVSALCDQSDAIDHLAQVSLDRAQFFYGDGALSEYAYAFGDDVKVRAAGRLGVSENRPLAPTRVEALAQCGMRGMVEQLLRIDTSPEGGQDADARVVGTLAHTVLEAFYKERPEIVRSRELEREDRDRLRALVKAHAEPLLEGRTTGHLAALSASFSWLEEALLRAVTVLTKTPPLPKAIPTLFECKIGTRGYREEGGPSYGAVPIPVGERTLYFGGEIDRVDEADGVRVVVDYKNQSASQVRSKLRGESVFTTHFQLPLYLRFLEHHDPSPPGTRLYAYLIPLRDGDIRHDDVLGAHPDFARRVLNDERSDGLAKSLERMLTPFFEGQAAPNQGGHCKTCRLSRVCRVPSAVSRPPSVFLKILNESAREEA